TGSAIGTVKLRNRARIGVETGNEIGTRKGEREGRATNAAGDRVWRNGGERRQLCVNGLFVHRALPAFIRIAEVQVLAIRLKNATVRLAVIVECDVTAGAAAGDVAHGVAAIGSDAFLTKV